MLKHTEQGCWMIVGEYLKNYNGFSHEMFMTELKSRNMKKMKAN